MQFEIQTTDEHRKTAVKRITFWKRIAKIITGGLLLLFVASYCTSYFIKYWGNQPLIVFVMQLLYNPLFWMIAIILLGIFAKNNLPEYLQAQYLNGFANYRDPFTFQISEDGVACYNGEQNIGAFTYGCFSDIIRTNNSILLADKNTVLFILPLSGFASEEEINNIFVYLSNKIDAANVLLENQVFLEIEPKDALSSFSSLLGSLTNTQILQATRKLVVPKKKWQTVYILMTIFGLLGCFAMFFFVPPVNFLPAFVVAAALYLTLLAVARRKSSTPFTPEYVPYFFYGNTIIEILPEGIRTYNTQFEIFLNWEQPYRVVESYSCYILTLYGSFLGYLPIPYGQYGKNSNLEKTIDYITINTSD